MANLIEDIEHVIEFAKKNLVKADLQWHESTEAREQHKEWLRELIAENETKLERAKADEGLRKWLTV